MPIASAHQPDGGEFTGKRILVTGGTKGAGKAIVDRLLKGGATVITTARSEPPAWSINGEPPVRA